MYERSLKVKARAMGISVEYRSLRCTGDVLRVDPSLISKIFQILYDSQSQPLINSSNSTMSTSMTLSQVRHIDELAQWTFLPCGRRTTIDPTAKRSSTKVIASSSLPIACRLNAMRAIVPATISSRLPRVSCALDAAFVVTSNISTIEKISLNHAEVGSTHAGNDMRTDVYVAYSLRYGVREGTSDYVCK